MWRREELAGINPKPLPGDCSHLLLRVSLSGNCWGGGSGVALPLQVLSDRSHSSPRHPGLHCLRAGRQTPPDCYHTPVQGNSQVMMHGA